MHFLCSVQYFNQFSLGVITTLAGTGKPGNKDNRDGMKASFHCPAGITVDQITGNVFVADQNNHCIRKISPQGPLLLFRVFFSFLPLPFPPKPHFIT
jgi:hypothetical protein